MTHILSHQDSGAMWEKTLDMAALFGIPQVWKVQWSLQADVPEINIRISKGMANGRAHRCEVTKRFMELKMELDITWRFDKITAGTYNNNAILVRIEELYPATVIFSTFVITVGKELGFETTQPSGHELEVLSDLFVSQWKVEIEGRLARPCREIAL